MQILVSASKTWADAGKSFEVVDASEVLLKSAEAVGLDTALMGVEKVAE